VFPHALGGRLRNEANRLAAGLAALAWWTPATAALHRVVNFLKPITSAVGDCAINAGRAIHFKPRIDKPTQLVVSAM